mgnify:CR=1 FL=1
MYAPKHRFVVRRVRSQTFLVPIGGNWNSNPALLELDPVGELIITCLPATADAVAQSIAERFDVDKETAREDATEFLEELVMMGLVHRAIDT